MLLITGRRLALESQLLKSGEHKHRLSAGEYNLKMKSDKRAVVAS